MMDRSIAYCPDYLANAGGIINLHHQRAGGSSQDIHRHVAGLATICRDVLERSGQLRLPTGAVADAIAQERVCAASGTP